MEHVTHSAEETMALGHAFGAQLRPNSIICFFGDLGAGKTTFIKGLVAGLTGHPEMEVQSPTFVYLNIYKGGKTVYHFDLFRLPSEKEFLDLGFDEYLDANGICCIEWAERITPVLPPHSIKISMAYQAPESRLITITRGVADA